MILQKEPEIVDSDSDDSDVILESINLKVNVPKPITVNNPIIIEEIKQPAEEETTVRHL